MKTNLKINITIEDICEGFIYSELEGKGLFGLAGKLTIQPEYQRNYIYASDGGKREVAVVDTNIAKSARDGSYVDVADYIKVKSAGKSITPSSKLSASVVDKIREYTPKINAW